MKIGNRNINIHNEPFIIAEMSGNHDGKLEKALQITEMAAKSGAHALKLQTYKSDTITLDVKESEFVIQDKSSLWHGKNLYELYDLAHTPWEWHAPIMKKANELGMVCFSSPFDESAVDFLEELEVPAYKIASFENNHIPLIKKVARTGKPIIISSGLATLSELSESIELIKNQGSNEVLILKCTSTYPAKSENSNINTIPKIKEIFDCEVGLSDHTLGIGVALASIGLGATAIEKHFTLDRSEGGVDAAFSLEPKELENLVLESRRAWQATGNIKFGPTKAEIKSLKFRRSIYISKDISEGEYFSSENLKVIRPGLGIAPKYFDLLIGKRACKNLKIGTPMSWEYIG